MRKKLNFIIAIALCLSASAIVSCKETMDDKLDKIEKIVKKWEAKKQNGEMSAEDCAGFKKEVENAGGNKAPSGEKDISEKQMERATSLGKRLAKLAVDCR